MERILTLEFDPEKHVYSMDGVAVPSVTQILKESGISDFSGIDGDTLMHAARRGTLVHSACHYFDDGDLDYHDLDEEIKPYVDAWEKFTKENECKFFSIEEQVHHPAYNYAGRLDRYGIVNNDYVTIDIKTGSLYPETALQLAAYKEALMASDCEVPCETQRWVVQLKNDGSYGIAVYDGYNDFDVFLAALSVANWKRAQRSE